MLESALKARADSLKKQGLKLTKLDTQIMYYYFENPSATVTSTFVRFRAKRGKGKSYFTRLLKGIIQNSSLNRIVYPCLEAALSEKGITESAIRNRMELEGDRLAATFFNVCQRLESLARLRGTTATIIREVKQPTKICEYCGK